MRPLVQLKVDGADRTHAITARLVSLRLTDEAGTTSDQLELELDDSEPALELPRKGVQIEVWLGYQDTGLILQGRFDVDEVGLSGPPARLQIRAKAADMRASLKGRKSRHWDAITLGDLVGQIASEHGLKARVAQGLAAELLSHLDQTRESDLNLLTRLARERDAVVAPKNGVLLFVAAAEGMSASGKDLPPIELSLADLIDWRAEFADRSQAGTVRARWRDLASASTRFESAGTGSPVQTLPRLYPDAAQAKAAAESHLARRSRDARAVSLSLVGRADLFAGLPIRIGDSRFAGQGDWVIERAEHSIDWSSGGYVTRLDLKSQTRRSGA